MAMEEIIKEIQLGTTSKLPSEKLIHLFVINFNINLLLYFYFIYHLFLFFNLTKIKIKYIKTERN